jgi:hypothetical protein
MSRPTRLRVLAPKNLCRNVLALGLPNGQTNRQTESFASKNVHDGLDHIFLQQSYIEYHNN